jgi:tetratricopeptide (TPR) repeat protein
MQPAFWRSGTTASRVVTGGLLALVCAASLLPRVHRLWLVNESNIVLAAAIRPVTASVACGVRPPQFRDAGEWEVARNQWRQAQTLRPDIIRPWLVAVFSPTGGGSRTLSEALIGSHDPLARQVQAWVAADQGRFDDAAAWLRTIASDPVPFVLHRAWVAFGRAEYEEAVQCFELVAHLDRTGSEGPFGRGRARQGLGQHTRAIADFDEAVRRCPSCADPYLFRAFSRSEAGQPDEVVEADLRRAVAAEPSNVVVLVHWADWMRGHRHFLEAEAQYRRAIQLNPTFLEPILGLADVYCATNRRRAAESLLSAAETRFVQPAERAQIGSRRQSCQ